MQEVPRLKEQIEETPIIISAIYECTVNKSIFTTMYITVLNDEIEPGELALSFNPRFRNGPAGSILARCKPRNRLLSQGNPKGRQGSPV